MCSRSLDFLWCCEPAFYPWSESARDKMPVGYSASRNVLGTCMLAPHGEEARSRQRTCSVRCSVSNHEPVARSSRRGLKLLRACEEFGPHPEELAKQASRRMDAT